MRDRFKDIDATIEEYRGKLNEAVDVASTGPDADPLFIDAQRQTIDMRCSMLRCQMEMMNNGFSAEKIISAVVLAVAGGLNPCVTSLAHDFLTNPPQGFATGRYSKYGSMEHAMVHVLSDLLDTTFHNMLRANPQKAGILNDDDSGLTVMTIEVPTTPLN